MKVNSFKQAQEYIYTFIPKENSTLYSGDFGLRRMKYFMQLLGNPQDKYKSIHIAGTSGKGSTAYLTSLLLINHGFKVGLILKPHILDIRERYQINNNLISEKEFCNYVNKLVPIINKMQSSDFGIPTYAEINTALAFLIFADKKVDYAVIETYLGGTYDCTNVINRTDKVVIISKLGFDHTKILGNTIAKIAEHKAGIIQSKNKVFSLYSKLSARNIIEKKIKTNNAVLDYIRTGLHFNNIRISVQGIIFDLSIDRLKIDDLNLKLFGKYQAENASLAIAAVNFLAMRDKFHLQIPLIRKAFKEAYFKGRGELLNLNGAKVIIDGAHNPQKMKEFITNLSQLYPKQKFVFLLGFVAGKDIKKMLRLLYPFAHSIILTGFFTHNQDWLKKANDPEELKALLTEMGYLNCVVVRNKNHALQVLLKDLENTKIITGSLYLISGLYPAIYKYLSKA